MGNVSILLQNGSMICPFLCAGGQNSIDEKCLLFLEASDDTGKMN